MIDTKTGLERKCARPGCGGGEFRIDGYCSIYCRDIHYEQMDAEDLRVELKSVKEQLAFAYDDGFAKGYAQAKAEKGEDA